MVRSDGDTIEMFGTMGRVAMRGLMGAQPNILAAPRSRPAQVFQGMANLAASISKIDVACYLASASFAGAGIFHYKQEEQRTPMRNNIAVVGDASPTEVPTYPWVGVADDHWTGF
ncbi:Hypp1701 [Branchiostoma lanceolatum]|uniref:Hypp1701 protein n=1 Tax=Branchiostoma lanceolatum TaxID=7740 RepID=A0A8J9ZMN0_BRALA|nr:Hypp1701 [Branchiostoma lanceolatum]